MQLFAHTFGVYLSVDDNEVEMLEAVEANTKKGQKRISLYNEMVEGRLLRKNSANGHFFGCENKGYNQDGTFRSFPWE